jgi:hypothetical protein
MSLLAKLKGGSRNVSIVAFPGRPEDKIALRVLSGQELQAAVFDAERRFKTEEIEIVPTTLEALEDERTTQLLFRALRNPDDPAEPYAESAEEIRKLLSREEKGLLASAYNEFERDCSPRIASLSEGEFEGIWQELKKNPGTDLSSFSSGTLRRLLLYSVSRPST